MSSGKHIVLISPGFPQNELDSGCIPPLQVYVRTLKSMHPSCRISILSLHYPQIRDRYEWHQVSVWPLHTDRWGWFSKLLGWFKITRLLKELHKEYPIDCVHCFWLNDTTLLPQRFCKKNSVPQLTTVMGQDALSSNRYLSLIDYSLLQVITLSRHAENHVRENTGVSPTAIIPWGIEPEIVNAQSKGIDEKEIDILVVSSMITVKNYPEIIEIISKVNKKWTNLQVVVFGDGPLKEEISRMIKSKGLENVIEFKGERPREEVLGAMQHSKLLLHCARYEGQGYVFLEALANGLPIVTYDIGFLPDSELVHICTSTEEMVSKAMDLILHSEFHSAEAPQTIRETVNEYWKIYNKEDKG